jgi:hypothetical protein
MRDKNLDIKVLRLLNESILLKEEADYYNTMKSFIKYLHFYESLHMDSDNLSYKKPLYKRFEQDVQNETKKALLNNTDKTYILSDDFKNEKFDILNDVISKYMDQIHDPNFRENFNTINNFKN